MPYHFSFVASEVDNEKFFPAQEPAQVGAMLDSSAGGIFARCVQSSVRYFSEGIADESPAVSSQIPPHFFKKTLLKRDFEYLTLLSRDFQEH